MYVMVHRCAGGWRLKKVWPTVRHPCHGQVGIFYVPGAWLSTDKGTILFMQTNWNFPLTFRTFRKFYGTKEWNVLWRPVRPNDFLSENPIDPTVFRNSVMVLQISIQMAKPLWESIVQWGLNLQPKDTVLVLSESLEREQQLFSNSSTDEGPPFLWFFLFHGIIWAQANLLHKLQSK